MRYSQRERDAMSDLWLEVLEHAEKRASEDEVYERAAAPLSILTGSDELPARAERRRSDSL